MLEIDIDNIIDMNITISCQVALPKSCASIWFRWTI
jgi:hypothetical protein